VTTEPNAVVKATARGRGDAVDAPLLDYQVAVARLTDTLTRLVRKRNAVVERERAARDQLQRIDTEIVAILGVLPPPPVAPSTLSIARRPFSQSAFALRRARAEACDRQVLERVLLEKGNATIAQITAAYNDAVAAEHRLSGRAIRFHAQEVGAVSRPDPASPTGRPHLWKLDKRPRGRA
jgi:hypothetical protein